MGDRYREIYAGYRWSVPPDFNIAHYACRRWASDPRAHRAALGGRVRTVPHADLPRDTARRQSTLERAARAGHRPGRSRGTAAAAAPGNARRLRRLLPDGRDRRAAVVPVRPRCARVPPVPQRREGGDRGPGDAREPGDDPSRPCPARARAGGGRRAGVGHARLGNHARQGVPGIRSARAPRDRSRRDHLHQRHDRASQGNVAAPLRAHRKPPGFRAFPRRLSARRRPLLDPGRLGLDGRPLGRAHAHALSRPRDPRIPRALRSRARLAPDREARRAQRFPGPHGAQDDDEGRPVAPPPPRAAAAHADERGRGPGPDGAALGPRRAAASPSTRSSARRR